VANSPLVKKLQLKADQKAAIINAPPGYVEALGELPEGVELTKRLSGGLDFVQVFVKDSAELKRFGPKAIRAVKPDGMLWICYPKSGSKAKGDLNRDVIWGLVKEYGLLGVSLIAVDDVWSAMRFRPADKVGK
jgi:hypothetical protein